MSTMRAVSLLVLLACIQVALGYPGLWVAEKKGCLAHPTTKESGHKAPTTDSAIKFVIKNAAGAAVQTVCPGVSYSVTVLYPEARLPLTTASVGVLGSQDKGVLKPVDKDCPGRVWYYGTANKTASSALKWDVPCKAPASAQLRTTSAAGSSKGFNAATSTVTINPGCAAAACAKAKTPAKLTAASPAPTDAKAAAAPVAGTKAAASPAPTDAKAAASPAAAAKAAAAPAADAPAAASPKPAAPKSAAGAASAGGLTLAAAGLAALLL